MANIRNLLTPDETAAFAVSRLQGQRDYNWALADNANALNKLKMYYGNTVGDTQGAVFRALEGQRKRGFEGLVGGFQRGLANGIRKRQIKTMNQDFGERRNQLIEEGTSKFQDVTSANSRLADQLAALLEDIRLKEDARNAARIAALGYRR
jgi:hypothetical protein